MNIPGIISIVTAGIILLINVYYLGDRHGYERGFNDGKYKVMLEEFPKRIYTYTNKED